MLYTYAHLSEEKLEMLKLHVAWSRRHNAAILDAISCVRLVAWALLVHDIVSNVSVALSLSRFLLSCCSCPTRLALCRFCLALLFLLFDMNKGLIHNECYSNGAVVAHIQSMLLRKLTHTHALRLFCICIYIYMYFFFPGPLWVENTLRASVCSHWTHVTCPVFLSELSFT